MDLFIQILMLVLIVGCKLFYPDNKAFSYYGRFDMRDPKSYKFDWSGSRIQVKFLISDSNVDSPSVGINLQEVGPPRLGVGNYYNVFINGELNVLSTIYNTTEYTLSAQKGWNTLEIQKRTEADYGYAQFLGLSLVDEIDSLPDDYEHKLLFLGDSLTVGYGSLGKYPCSESEDVEDVYVTYDGLVSREFKSDYHLVAWSGKGLVRNCDTKGQIATDPLPSYLYDTCGSAPSVCGKWDFSNYQPDAVFIDLGANDFSDKQYYPTETEYLDGYDWLLQNLTMQITQTDPYYFLICGWIDERNHPWCDYVPEVVKKWSGKGLKATFINLSDLLQFPDDYGCDDHPNVNGHKKWADYMIPIIKKTTGWGSS